MGLRRTIAIFLIGAGFAAEFAASPAVASWGQIESRLLSGDVALPGEWPDVAAVAYSGGVVACTGTLIASDLVLTAKHCVDSGPVRYVALGAASLEDATELLDVLYVWRAPEGLDAAVLLIADAAEVAPRPLLDACSAGALVPGATATIAGYGATDVHASVWDGLLRHATVAIEDPACDDPALGCMAWGAELVAGGGGVDTCVGDSGGPLFLHTPEGLVLAGVTSRGTQEGEVQCGQGGIYVRTDVLAPMIEAHFGRPLERIHCEDGRGCAAAGSAGTWPWMLGLLVWRAVRSRRGGVA